MRRLGGLFIYKGIKMLDRSEKLMMLIVVIVAWVVVFPEYSLITVILIQPFLFIGFPLYCLFKDYDFN